MFNKINISSKRQILIIYVVLTLATLAVFRQVHQYSFINFDDIGYVTQYSNIQSGITNGFLWAFTTRYADLWNPLVWLSFMFDYQLHGLNAGGYHVTNLILHIFSAFALLAFLPHDGSYLAKRLCRGALCASSISCGIGCLDI